MIVKACKCGQMHYNLFGILRLFNKNIREIHKKIVILHRILNTYKYLR